MNIQIRVRIKKFGLPKGVVRIKFSINTPPTARVLLQEIENDLDIHISDFLSRRSKYSTNIQNPIFKRVVISYTVRYIGFLFVSNQSNSL